MNTMCVGHHYLQANTNNVNKTRVLLQTTGGKDEPNIVCMRKNIFDIYVTEYGTALTTILPILFLYLNTVIVTAGTFEP